jgi:hypothetical protein
VNASRRCAGPAFGAVFVMAGCAIEPIDLADRQCDDEHPCAAEYTCVDNVCERTDSLEGASTSE